MDMARGHPAPRGWKGAASPAFLAVIAMGLLSLVLMLWTDELWRIGYRKTVPLLDNLMHARDSFAQGHLWLEELLRGNHAIEVDMVADSYRQSVAAVEDALGGRSAIPNLPGVSPEDPALVEELTKYKQLSDKAHEVAQARWQQAARGEPVEIPDVQLHLAFHALGLVAKAINTRVQGEVRTVIDTQRRLRDLTLGLWLSLLAGVSWALFVAGRRRRLAEEALRGAHADLEHKVEERTASLAAANALLQTEIEERKRAEAALVRSEGESRLLSAQLLAFQEDERARLARELHDGIVQTMSAVLLRVELALGRAGERGAEAASEAGGSAVRMLQGAMDDLRRMYMDLRPSLLDDLGLLAAANWFCRQFRETFPGVDVACEWELAEAAVPARLKTVIYRILQECLNNVGRHSGANTATIRVSCEGDRLELTVEDDGIGFDVEQALSIGDVNRGLGLRSMRHRAEASGGHLSVESTPGTGTRVRAVWPIQRVITPTLHPSP